MSESRAVLSQIRGLADSLEKRFAASRRVLSFAEYLELCATDPTRYARDASRYLRDAFDHYGTKRVQQPWGAFNRWKLFDLPLAQHAPVPLPRCPPG